MTPLLLEKIEQRLVAECGLQPVTASEIEFYLQENPDASIMSAFWAEVAEACVKAQIALFNYGSEEGQGQYEASLKPAASPSKTAQDTLALKQIITKVATANGLLAGFGAKPYDDQPGSALHIHIHLNDVSGKNAFYKDDERINDTLKYSIGGLLTWLPECMAIFAPTPESYRRFADKHHVPTTVSWGANNRTVAIRLPISAHENKHIEHRVSGADADPVAVMAVLLAAIHHGLTHQCDPGSQIYGNASLPMYELPHFPCTMEEAAERWKNFTLWDEYASTSEN